MEIEKNKIYISEAVDYTSEGNGVFKINGMTVFVPNAAVGDKAEIKIVKVGKNYAFGRLERLICPSPDRIETDCAISCKCGGCVFRHIRYSAELKFKKKRVYDALTRIGGIDGSIIGDIVPSPLYNAYRNKAQLPVTIGSDGKIRVGFFAPRSHRVIPFDYCSLQAAPFNRAIKPFLEWANTSFESVYDPINNCGVLRHLYLRYSYKTNELMVCIVANSDKLKNEEGLVEILKNELPELKTVILNTNKEKTNVITGKKCRNLYGNGYITDELCGLKFRISPLSFYQVNRDAAEKLYEIAADFANLKSNETLIDMYCGTGTIGLSMASKVKNLIGIEIIPQAIDDARKNAEINRVKNSRFICSDALEAAKILCDEGVRPDCIILDPPRKGCDSELISVVSKMSPDRIIYVSCDPATLARDLSCFVKNGYSVKKALPVDMFPRTAHVETVCLMSRVEGK